MGQKVRPTGFRTGVMIDWKSQWSASAKKEFPELLLEDKKIRTFINKEYKAAMISMVRIERTREKVIVYIHAAKVGSIIGQKGAKIDELTEKLTLLAERSLELIQQAEGKTARRRTHANLLLEAVLDFGIPSTGGVAPGVGAGVILQAVES